MTPKKAKAGEKKHSSSKKNSMAGLRKDHPFETDSQIQNRYGDGREKNGSDGTNRDAQGSNH